MGTDSGHTDALLTVAATLRVDALAAEALTAFDEAQIPSILLKGRAFADLLYPSGARPYNDVDLLVPPGRLESARRALRRLGYAERPTVVGLASPGSPHARHWDRAGDDAHVDLHERLDGVDVGADVLWAALEPHAVGLWVGGTAARGLDPAASGMLCALHLASHGPHRKPLEDLRRATDLLDRSDWVAAHELALSLGAEEPFIAGLRFSQAGSRLADSLGLPSALSARRILQGDPDAPSSARAIETLFAQTSLLGWARSLSVVLLPSKVEMRRHHALARRGRAGLAAAYALRPLRLAVRSPTTLAVWVRARRAAARRPPGV